MVVIAIVVESSCTLRANQLLRRFTPLIALRCRLRCASLFLLSGSEMLNGFWPIWGANPEDLWTNWIIKGQSSSMLAVIDRCLWRIDWFNNKGPRQSLQKSRKKLICLRWFRGHSCQTNFCDNRLLTFIYNRLLVNDSFGGSLRNKYG